MDLSKSYEYFQPEKDDARVHIIGCGSVGGTLAELLVRLGLTKLTLWDFDDVEAHNLANQIYRQKDIGRKKTEALLDILAEINPDVRNDAKLMSDGWDEQELSGYVFLAVDNIELRRKIAQQHLYSIEIKAMFDFRTGLEDAQHYACDWSDIRKKKDFLKSMDFSHEEAAQATPVSACGVILGVAPTVRGICAVGIANFVNFARGKDLKKMMAFDIFMPDLMAF